MNNLLLVNDVTKSYTTGYEKINILNNISFSLNKGDLVSIQGISGAGKTTFLNLIGGFDSPDSGSIVINDTDITKLNEYEIAGIRCNNIGYIFQAFYLIKELNVIENVMLPALKKGLKQHEAFDKAEKVLHTIGLQDRMKHYPNQLSGGEQQRVAIARAVINDPDIICADEPTGNLDIKNKNSIIEMLFKVVSEKNLSLILVTHDNEISSRCRKQYYIDDCKIKER